MAESNTPTATVAVESDSVAASEVTPVESRMIALSDEQFEALVTASSRPSPYEQDVRNAVFGKGYAVIIGTTSYKTIVNWLKKAEKAVGVKLQINTREKAVTPTTPNGVVVWTLAVDPAAEPAK